MKILIVKKSVLLQAKRWDIDFHLPAEKIKEFPKSIVKQVKDVAYIKKEKRDPTLEKETPFRYIDISCIDVRTGLLNNHQDLIGEEAPSRARKVVSAFDIIISTCRPTRGAIAVVPLDYHNEVASTGFSVLTAKDGVNPFYLFFALRLGSTLEQFRKFSTGSSYPAILDEDVLKTLIPVPSIEEQDRIAKEVFLQIQSRERKILEADRVMNNQLHSLEKSLIGDYTVTFSGHDNQFNADDFMLEKIISIKSELPDLKTTQSIKDSLSE